MYYTKQFQEEFEAIVNDKGGHVIEGLLMLISLELFNIANELHEQTELHKMTACMPDKMILNSEGAEIKYKSITETLED